MLLYELFQKNIKSIKLHDLFYITISQIYLLSISFTNVSTPRYLMTIYPILIIILLSLVNLFFNQKKEDLILCVAFQVIFLIIKIIT